MNYRHQFHAGNHADVLKHTVLVCLLDRMVAKDKPLVYLETHAGAGRYVLPAPDPDPTAPVPEYLQGIQTLAQPLRIRALPPVQRYLDLVAQCNPGPLSEGVRLYPGSPLLAAAVLRQQDTMRLAEWESGAASALIEALRGDRRVLVQPSDGYAALRAWLPPQPRRGVVLLDPPYERSDEFERLADAVEDGLRRWPVGIFAVWYPIKAYSSVQPWLRRMAGLHARSILLAELCVHPDDTALRLNGSGLLIVQPPWHLEADLRAVLPALHRALAQSPRSRWTVRWLRAEGAASADPLNGPPRGKGRPVR